MALTAPRMNLEEPMTKLSCIVPPLKWHGGKHYLAKHILGLMPRHLHYVETHFGGGQVLFARHPADQRLWWPGLTSDGRKPDGVSEVINDINGDLMNFYAVLKDPRRFEDLHHRLELTLFAQREWEAARDLLAQPGEPSVERAAALFTFCRQSLAARMRGFATPVRTRLRGGRNDGVNSWWGAIEGLEAVHRRLQNVMILNKDAVDVIRSEDGLATLFYCDPPYLHETRTAKQVYKYEMTQTDHRKLLEALLRCRGKVILSGYANRLYDDMLHDWSRHTFDLPNNAAGGKQKERETEVLWCNFRRPGQSDELDKLRD
jgi:DNA adenine methylase